MDRHRLRAQPLRRHPVRQLRPTPRPAEPARHRAAGDCGWRPAGGHDRRAGAPGSPSHFDGQDLKPAPGSPAAARRPGRISALLADADGSSVWLADATASGGLFRLHPAGDRMGLEEVRRQSQPGQSGQPVVGATALAPDGAGGLWVGTPAGLLHRLADGRWSEHPLLPPPQRAAVVALLLDSQHRLWVATAEALLVLETDSTTSGELRRFDSTSGFAGMRRSGRMVQTRDGRIWMTTNGGLSVYDGEKLRTYTRRNGLLPDELAGLAEDRDGNLWVGTRSHGLMRLAPDGFLTYGAAEETAGTSVARSSKTAG